MQFLQLGLTDFWVAAAVWLSLLTTLFSLIYGFFGKAKSPNTDAAQPKFTVGKETIFWAETERKLDDEL